MNDDFLHRIRVAPPAGFLARLKARLDLQPAPTPPSPGSPVLRAIAIAVLFAGAAFAITLLTVKRGTQEAPTDTNTAQALREVPAISLPEAPRGAKRTSSSADVNIDSQTAANVKSMSPPTAVRLVTPKSLEPYLTEVLERYKFINIATADSTSAALAGFCGPHEATKPDTPAPLFALANRRITQSEFDACTHNIGRIAEVPVGHQAMVIARSKLYGTFTLTPRQIFLALAAEIADPAQPDKLIPNPNTTWSDVDSTLEREPIEIVGPDPSSPAGIAFREILFESGCRELPEWRAAKHCPDLRKDGVYSEAPQLPVEVIRKLQSRPNALGILGYALFEQYANELAASPMGGVVPTRDTLTNGTYPAARPLYLYIIQQGANSFTPYLTAALTNPGWRAVERFAIVPHDPAPQKGHYPLPSKLPDLKM